MFYRRHILVLWSMVAVAALYGGGGKSAYKNYFLGSYYFAEGQYDKAENYLRKAYEAQPDEYNFTVAFALVLGRNGKPNDGLKLINRSNYLPPAAHPEYQQLISMRHYITGLIHCYGQRYRLAIQPLESAIRIQRTLNKPELLASMMNTLGYARFLHRGLGAGPHRTGSKPHYHLHARNLERSRLIFEEALRIDPTQVAAVYNYLMLCDTLGAPSAFEELKPVNRSPNEQVVSSRYASLPVDMGAVLPFREYDDIVLLLDISGSMVMEKVSCVGQTRFEVMRETSLFFLDSLTAGQQLGIATIGGDCGTTPKLWHSPGAISREELRQALEFLVPDGTTPLLTILQQTIDLFGMEPERRRSIFFISDGENICRLPGVDICQWSEGLAARGITINILTFLGASLDNRGAFAEYTCLADNTGGKVLNLDTDRCSFERYQFDIAAAAQFYIPPFEQVSCGGPGVKPIWAVYPEAEKH